MRKIVLLALSFVCLLNVAAIFEKFNFVEPDQFKEWLVSGKPMLLVDIQEKAGFAAAHFPASMETNAFPVETAAERARLDPAVEAYKKNGHEVIVLCPRGGGGAKRTYSYLKSQGVPEEKLFILSGGVEKWPYREMLQTGK